MHCLTCWFWLCVGKHSRVWLNLGCLSTLWEWCSKMWIGASLYVDQVARQTHKCSHLEACVGGPQFSHRVLRSMRFVGRGVDNGREECQTASSPSFWPFALNSLPHSCACCFVITVLPSLIWSSWFSASRGVGTGQGVDPGRPPAKYPFPPYTSSSVLWGSSCSSIWFLKGTELPSHHDIT